MGGHDWKACTHAAVTAAASPAAAAGVAAAAADDDDADPPRAHRACTSTHSTACAGANAAKEPQHTSCHPSCNVCNDTTRSDAVATSTSTSSSSSACTAPSPSRRPSCLWQQSNEVCGADARQHQALTGGQVGAKVSCQHPAYYCDVLRPQLEATHKAQESRRERAYGSTLRCAQRDKALGGVCLFPGSAAR